MPRSVLLAGVFAGCVLLLVVGPGAVWGEDCNSEYGNKEFCKTYEKDWVVGGADVTACDQVEVLPAPPGTVDVEAWRKAKCNVTGFIVSEFLVLSCGKGSPSDLCLPAKNADDTYKKTKCATYTTCRWHNVNKVCEVTGSTPNTTQYAENMPCQIKIKPGGEF